MDKIYYGRTLVALRIRTISRGSLPITQEKEPLQVVTLKHPKGAYLKAHTHTPKQRVTEKLQECLIVKMGKVKIDLYAPDKTLFKKVTLRTGDLFIMVDGGYGIHLLEDSELIEVKNGPFVEDKLLIDTDKHQ